MTSNTFSSNNGIPNEIKSLERFCLGADGTGIFSKKQPLTFESGMLKPANTKGVWVLKDYPTMVKLVEENNISSVFNAVGFLPPEHIIVIDIDAHGKPLSAEEQSFVDKCAKETYVEKSISGTGYHILYHTGNPLMMDKLDAVDLGGFTVEIFGGSNPTRYILLTGESNGLEIDSIPDELRKCIQNHKKPETSKNSFISGDSTNESSYLLNKIEKPPAVIYCELFEGTIEKESHNGETRCITNMFDKKFGLDAHHFGVKPDGTWCLYGNNMRGGSLLEAVSVVKGLYNFEEGNINPKDIPKLIKITKERFNIKEETTITIEGLHEIQKQASEARSIYKPYYPQIKDALPALMRDFVESLSLKSDAYQEYGIVNMLFIGSLITCGSAQYIPPFAYNDTPQPISFRSFILGKSSVSRKSTALKHTRGLLGDIKTKWSVKKYGQHVDSRMVIPSKNFPTDLGNINSEARLCQDFDEKNNQFLIIDEFANNLKAMKKDYNGSLRDYLCLICDNTSFNKKLKKERGENQEYHIINPIFNASVASTPDGFAKYATEDDATSGYLYRFLFCCPSYTKQIKSMADARKNGEKAKELTNDVSNRLADIMLFFESAEKPMIYQFSDESSNFIGEWAQEKNKKLDEEKQLSLQARFESYILDIAVILHILSECHTVESIDLPTCKLAAELIDGLFRPSGEFMLDSTMQDDLNKLIGLCKKYGAGGQPIAHTKLLHYSHFDKNKFDVLINTLIDSARVVRRERETPSNNRKTAYEYIWVDFTN